jgi:hypothetical protein
MPDPKKKSNKQQQDEERTARIVELSKQWGVPTNAIFSKVKYRPTSIWQSPNDALPEYREYFMFNPQGQIGRSVTDRFEDTSIGYSGSTYNFQTNPPPPQEVPSVAVSNLNQQSLIPQKQLEKGGSLNFKSNDAYKKWIAYGHATGIFESTPGNQKISIKGNKHKVKHAAYGDSLQPIYYDNPYVVNNQLQNPIPYQPYTPQIPASEPLRQGLQNVSNYFDNQPANLIPNNASLQGPSFYQPENLLNADTGQVSQSSYQPLNNPFPDIGQPAPTSPGNKFSMPNIRLNTGAPIMALAGLVNSVTQENESAEEYARQARKNSMTQGYNPFPYGTGSQVIFADGGELSSSKAKKMLKDGKANGRKLTDKQKRYFGWVAGGKKAQFGVEIPNHLPIAEDGIEIKKSHKGLFTKKANTAGQGVQEYANYVLSHRDNFSPQTIKQANFAHVFGGHNYAHGGYMPGQTYDLTPEQIAYLQNAGYQIEIK